MSAGSRNRRRHFYPQRVRVPRCPTCGKVWAATESDAQRLYKQVAVHKGRSAPVRFYQAHGGYHWTRQIHATKKDG